MNNLVLSPSLLSLNPSSFLFPPRLLSPPLHTLSYHHYPKTHSPSFLAFPLISRNPSFELQSSISTTTPSDQGAVSAVQFQDFVEKDWSFLDFDSTDSDEDHARKIDRIISAGEIEETAKVLISIGSETFVDRLVESTSFKELLVVHESLFILACIKEKYDKVKCWQGELLNVPDKWQPFDVVFLYFLPAIPFELDQILGSLSVRCSPGARLVISLPKGKQVVEEQQQLHPDTIFSNLPEKMILQNTAANHSFEVVEFIDEPNFYLTVLRHSIEAGTKTEA